jgi:hypothetical protein
VPRLSLWKNGQHTNDYRYFDKLISEQFTLGGTGVLLHKYLGPINQSNTYITTTTVSSGNTLFLSNVASLEVGQTVNGAGINANTVIFSTNVSANSITLTSNVTSTVSSGQSLNIFWKDASKPNYLNQSATNIQDLLFLENRDRKYDSSVYTLRGIYTVNDNDFNLSQFGIFMSADTIYMTFHLTDTVAYLGRKIISGDVVELQHKKDYYPLNNDIPNILKRYYVVEEVTFAADGFSQTWWPHLSRVKLNPLVDSQEYKDILNQISNQTLNGNSTPFSDYLSTLDKFLEINDAIIEQAEIDVVKSGTNVDELYVLPLNPDGSPGDPTGIQANNMNLRVNSTRNFAAVAATTPDTNIPAYLGGDGAAPNGWPVGVGTSFPTNPEIGDYFLRTDYVPNRLFRYDGVRWIKIEDSVRTNLTPGPNNKTQRSIFVNNTDTYVDDSGQTLPSRQSLSKALTPKADS